MPVTFGISAGRLMKIELKDDTFCSIRGGNTETLGYGHTVRDRLSPTVTLAIKGRSYTS